MPREIEWYPADPSAVPTRREAGARKAHDWNERVSREAEARKALERRRKRLTSALKLSVGDLDPGLVDAVLAASERLGTNTNSILEEALKLYVQP